MTKQATKGSGFMVKLVVFAVVGVVAMVGYTKINGNNPFLGSRDERESWTRVTVDWIETREIPITIAVFIDGIEEEGAATYTDPPFSRRYQLEPGQIVRVVAVQITDELLKCNITYRAITFLDGPKKLQAPGSLVCEGRVPPG